MKFDEDTSAKELNEILRRGCGFGLANLENSLREVLTTFRLIGFMKRARELEEACKGLEASRTNLLRKVDAFLVNSGGWREIRREHDIKRLGGKYEFIKEAFHLEGYFERVDQETARLRRRIIFIKAVNLPASEKKKRVQTHTMLVLVWLRALEPHCGTLTNLYGTVHRLLLWFLVNNREMLGETADIVGELDESTIRRDYERYIQSPPKNLCLYRESADAIHRDNFPLPKSDPGCVAKRYRKLILGRRRKAS